MFYFILTTLTTNGVRYRITQNFKQHLVLQQNDDGDYSTVLGKTDGLFPAKLKGRGLVKTDKLVEFQSAHISRVVSTFDAVQEKCEELHDNWNGKTAEKIPVLPEIVDADFLLPHINDKQPLNLPVGVNKNTLRVQRYDFALHCINILLSAGDEYVAFLSEFMNLILRVPNLKITIFDPEGKLSLDDSLNSKDGFQYFNNIQSCNDGVVWMHIDMRRSELAQVQPLCYNYHCKEC